MRKNPILDKYVIEKVECRGRAPEKRFGHGAYKFDKKLFVFGGWNGIQCQDDFFEYSWETQLWYEIKLAAGVKPESRYRFDGDIIGGKLYIFGGVNDKQIRFNDLYEFTINTR